MDRIMVAMAIGAGLVFGIGVLIGIMTMIAMAVRKEDRLHTLTSAPPSAMARGVRRMAGVGLRDISPPDDVRM
jgi:hypothetical protein